MKHVNREWDTVKWEKICCRCTVCWSVEVTQEGRNRRREGHRSGSSLGVAGPKEVQCD